jgi:hypothetical protein
MVIVKAPGLLSPFQKWVILRFHQEPQNNITDVGLVTGCCITAMDASFKKETALKDLEDLVLMQLIRASGRQQSDEIGFGRTFHSTVDGIIYAKQMMKPILDAMNKKDFENTLQKLDNPEALQFLQSLFRTGGTQQDKLSQIANFGIGNINGFTKIWELVIHTVNLLK